MEAGRWCGQDEGAWPHGPAGLRWGSGLGAWRFGEARRGEPGAGRGVSTIENRAVFALTSTLVQVLRYGPTNKYGPHMDGLNRVMSVLIYLVGESRTHILFTLKCSNFPPRDP